MDFYFFQGLILCMVLVGIGLAIQAGAATAAWVSQIGAWMGRRPFWDKFGQQMLGLSMTVFIWAVVFALLGLGLGYARFELQLERVIFDLPWMALTWPLAGLGLGLFFSLLAAKTWRPLKRRKGLQAILLFPAWVFLWAGMYVGLNQAFIWQSSLSVQSGIFPLETLWKPPFCPVWVLMAGQAVIVGLGGAGTLGMSYLLARRQAEDYGRDYYRFALPSAARLGALLLGQGFFLAWVVYRQVQAVWLLPAQEMIALGLSLVGFVLYGVLLIVFLRSAHPLRAKASALGASGLGIIAGAAAGLSQVWLLG